MRSPETDWSVRFGTGLCPWPWARLGNHGTHKRGCQGHGDLWEELWGKSLKEISGGNLFWRIKAFCLWKRDWFGLVLLYVCSHFACESVSRSARRNRKRFEWVKCVTNLKICHWPPHSLEDKVCSAHSLSNFLPLFSSTPFTHAAGNASCFLPPKAFLAHSLSSGSTFLPLHLASPVYLSNLNASMTF